MQARACGIALLPQYRWHPERRFRADFSHEAARVLVEIEGGAWIGGRHTSGSGFVADARKHALAAELGWRVLRVVPEMVRDGTGMRALCAMVLRMARE